MGILIAPYVKKDKSISMTHVKMYNKSKNKRELDTSSEFINELIDRTYVALKEKPSYYKVGLTFSTFQLIKKYETQHPDHEFYVDFHATGVYNTFTDQYKKEYDLYRSELKAIQNLWEYKRADKVMTLKNYEFPKFKLRNHQLIMMALVALIRRAAVFGDKGVGKTASALHGFNYKRKKGTVHKCLVICPNTIKFKWAEGEDNEVNKHTDLNGIVVDGNKETRLAIINKFTKDPDLDIMVTSYSFWSGTSYKKMVTDEETGEEVEIRVCRNHAEYQAIIDSGIDMIIIDESHRIKNSDAQVVKHLKQYIKNVPHITIMTGTPLPNHLTDIFSQFLILDPAIYGGEYMRFQRHYFDTTTNTYPVFKSETKEAEFKRKLESKSIVYRAEECLQLPAKIYDRFYIELSPEYKEALLELANSEDLSRLSMTSLDSCMSKLLQICSGFVYDPDGNPIYFKNNPKIELLSDNLDDIIDEGQKSIIWYHFRADIKPITDMLNEKGVKYLLITKDTPSRDRIQIIKDFEKDKTMQVIVTSSYLTSEGVDIVTARYAHWYNLTPQFDKVDQAEARNRRFGSIELHDTIWHYHYIMKGSVERRLSQAIERKQSYQDFVFGFVEYLKNNKTVKLELKDNVN